MLLLVQRKKTAMRQRRFPSGPHSAGPAAIEFRRPFYYAMNHSEQTARIQKCRPRKVAGIDDSLERATGIEPAL